MDRWEGAQLNEAKRILAHELTAMVHGEEEANKAQEAAKSLFAGGVSSDNMPEAVVREEDFKEGEIDILAVLVLSGLAQSRSDARRAVEQGGVSVNGDKVTDIHTSYRPSDFAEEFLLRRGKKKYCKITSR